MLVFPRLFFPRLSLLPLIVVSAALGGCSGNPGPTLDEFAPDTANGGSSGVISLASVTTYGAANAIVTTGYSEKELAPDRFEVRVKGSIVTPPERLEKIALARAAEIGIEQKFKFFKSGAFAHSVMCKEAKNAAHKNGKVAADRAPAVTVDVVYAKGLSDPS